MKKKTLGCEELAACNKDLKIKPDHRRWGKEEANTHSETITTLH